VHRLLLEEAGVAGIAGAAFGPGGKPSLRSRWHSPETAPRSLERTARLRFTARRGFPLNGDWFSGSLPGRGAWIYFAHALLMTLAGAVAPTRKRDAPRLRSADFTIRASRSVSSLIPIYTQHRTQHFLTTPNMAP